MLSLLGFLTICVLGLMLLGGIKQVASTGIMLIFAVLHLSIMINTGLFDR